MIETEDYKVVYDCDGNTVRFDFAFQITEEDDLDVKRYDSVGLVEATLILGSDYTMEQATVGTWLDGGTVVTGTAYITNDRISLTRDVDSKQLLDYRENDPFPAESHEGGLDKLTIIAQQLEEMLSRSMLIPKSDPAGLDLEIASLEARLGKIIQFDETTGEPKIVSSVSTGTITFTAWGELWVGNANADAGLDQLSFTTYTKSLVPITNAQDARNILGTSPVGVIIPWIPGYFGDGSNGSFTGVSITLPDGWEECDGAEFFDADSPIFDDAGRFLPNLTDDRFLMGDIAGNLGAIGGSNDAIAVTHDHSSTGVPSNNTSAGPSTNTTNTNSVSHYHTEAYSGAGGNNAIGFSGSKSTADVVGTLIGTRTGNANTTHTHTMQNHTHTMQNHTHTVASAGSSGTDANIPKYLACKYIMRTK